MQIQVESSFLVEQSGQLAQALQNYQRSYSINNLQPMVAERVASLSRQISANYEASMSAANQTQIATPSSFQSGLIRR